MSKMIFLFSKKTRSTQLNIGDCLACDLAEGSKKIDREARAGLWDMQYDLETQDEAHYWLSLQILVVCKLSLAGDL